MSATFSSRLFVCLAWVLILGCASPPSLAKGDGDGSVEVGLIHINDVYQIAPIDPVAPRGGLARLATLVREIKRGEPGTLLVFGGDTLSPGVESGVFQGRQMIAAWNALAVDVAVPGNHEFDFGEEVLRARLAESAFPWLAANLEAGRPLPSVKRSELRVINGVRVGLIGLLTPDTRTLSKPGDGLQFGDLLAAAEREAGALRRQGAEVLVALTHCTLAEDRRLAASGLFDLILGGHDHHLVTELVGRTPIFKAGSDARDAIHVRLRLAPQDGGHRLVGLGWNIVPVDARWAEDAAVKTLAGRFELETTRLLGETVGATDVALDARGATLRRGESNLGNFVADAVREAMGSEVALLNGGGFRADRVLGPGPLTRRDLLALLPFRNPLLLLSIRGAALREVLEHGLDRRVEAGQSGAMPHVSGMRLTYDARQPKGRRLVAITIGGQPLADDRTYTLATSNYLAGGGDGYALLKALPVLRPAEGSPVETDVVIEAVQRAGRIAPVVDGRLREAP